MHFSTLVILAGLATIARAHFQVEFPAPRGPFVEDDEPNFCDGFDSAVSNRTIFPLDNGYYTFNSEHPVWSMGVYLSTAQNPTSFDNFSKTPVKPFFKSGGEGLFCIPIDLGAANVTDGANVTLQFQFDGGDGNLYQCADLTLSKTVTIPSNVTCTNATNTSTSSASQSPSASSTAPASTQQAGGVGHVFDMPVFVTVLLGFTSVALSFF